MNPDLSSVRAALQADRQYLLDLLAELVNINSLSANRDGVNRVIDRLGAEYALLGLETERMSHERFGDVLVARSQAALRGKSVLLVGHADTVHSPESPFSRFSSDGKHAFGPGVLDMKGGLVVMLGALRALHSAGLLASLPVTVVLNGDEEVSSPFSGPVIEDLCKEAFAALVFEWGRAQDGLISRRKGILKFELRVSGRAAHAGNAIEQGANAVLEAAHKALALGSLNDSQAGVSCNVGYISGGQTTNVVPDRASLRFEVRAGTGAALAGLREKIDRIVSSPVIKGTEASLIELGSVVPMEKLAGSGELIARMIRAGEASGVPFREIQGVLGGASNANHIAGAGVPVLDGLGPRGDFAHTDREFVILESFLPRMEALVRFLADLPAPD